MKRNRSTTWPQEVQASLSISISYLYEKIGVSHPLKSATSGRAKHWECLSVLQDLKTSNTNEEIHILYKHIILSTTLLPKPCNTKQNTGEKSVWVSWCHRQGTEPSQRRVLKTQHIPQYRIWSPSLCSTMCLRTNWALRITLEMRENYFVFQLCCNPLVCCYC